MTSKSNDTARRYHLFCNDDRCCGGMGYHGSFVELDDTLVDVNKYEMVYAEIWENTEDGSLAESYNLKLHMIGDDDEWTREWAKVKVDDDKQEEQNRR